MRSCRLSVVLSIFAIYAVLIFPALPIWGAEAPSLRVGVAKVDITPKELAGLVGIGGKFQGVRDPLYARALVLDDGSTTAAIVGMDLVEFGNTLSLRERIARELGIPAGHIMIAASHDHNAPRGGPVTPGTSSVQGRPYSTPAYTQQIDDSVVEVLRQAKASLQPARVGIGAGRADVNVYDRVYTANGWKIAPNEDGPSDKTVWVVKFENLSGEPVALLMNYAVHSNVIAGSRAKAENLIAGDISGVAERYVERQFNDKVIALWTMGAAADQYAKFYTEWETWKKASPYELAEIQGQTLGMEVLQTANRITQMTPVARIEAAERAVPCQMNPSSGGPGRGAPPSGASSGPGQQQPPPPPQTPQTPQTPQPQQQQPPAMLDIHLGLIRINQIAITSVSGEVATNIYQHLKKVSPFANTMMVTLANDRAGYIPDDANWNIMSNAAFVRGCAEKAIVDNLVEMMDGSK